MAEVDPLPYLLPFAGRTFRRDAGLSVDMFALYEGSGELCLAAGPVEALADITADPTSWHGNPANEIALHPTTLRRLMAETRGASEGRAAA